MILITSRKQFAKFLQDIDNFALAELEVDGNGNSSEGYDGHIRKNVFRAIA